MSNLTYDTILAVTNHFYDKARFDILIGFHFRVIEDFDTHIPRIADFWNLQLTGKIENKDNLPFNLLHTHIPMRLTIGMIDRWVVLFHQSLDVFLKNEKLSLEDVNLWKKKIEIFKAKIKDISPLKDI